MRETTILDQDNSLKGILARHCQDPEKEAGLLLLTLPTGFGKTHYVLEYISEHLEREYPQRIWFITNLKKNLPWASLQDRIDPALFEKQVVFLNSYSDQVLEFFEQRNLPDLVLENIKASKSLLRAVKMYNAGSKQPDLKTVLTKQLAESERGFRAELKQWLSGFFGEGKTLAEKLDIIRRNSQLEWIVDMYPSVQYFEKTVFFCSIDKFYRYVDTIIGPNIQITTPKYIENSIVFIDEFDATKANIKNAIIENAVRFNQDIISLFIKIFYGIRSRKFPQARLEDAPKNKAEMLKEEFDRMVSRAFEVYGEFQLEFHYYYESGSELKRLFLFHDFQYHLIVEGKKKNQGPSYLVRHLKNEDATNYIELWKDKPDRDKDNLLFLLNSLRGLIHLFSFFVSNFAQTYKEAHDVRRSTNEEISIENAIRTTLDIFDITESRMQDYFIDQIFQQVYVAKRAGSTQFDFSPLNRGFRYYDILNGKAHDATTKILYADTLTTPETWLVNLCQLCKVVGISATAGFDSPVSNYSLWHLQHHLKDKFYEIDPNDQIILEAEFQRKNCHAGQREIRPVAIACRAKKKNSLADLFSEKELVDHFLENFSDNNDFEVQRYVKVAMAYRYYIQNVDIHSFLCLTNRFPKEQEVDKFRLDLLKELFAELRVTHLNETPEFASEMTNLEVEVLTGNNFSERQQQINERLANGERIFLISTYQTMGAGQNIQYPSPSSVPTVAINDLDYGDGKKDYDAIYLEKPTYLLQYFPTGADMTDENLLDYLFEVEYLAEAGGISSKEKNERIKYAFRRRLNPNLQPSPNNQSLYEREVFIQHATRIIIQAVGRLSRTRLKSPVTHLLYDEKIADYLQHFHRGNHLFVPEFEAIHDACQHSTGIVRSLSTDIERQNIYQSLTLAAQLQQLARRIPDWNDDIIEFWEKLRKFVLQNPTIPIERLQKSGLQKFYIKSPDGLPFDHYFFQTRDDFNRNLLIDYTHGKGREVSTEGALLTQLLRIPQIRELFEQKEFATSFRPNDYMLSPPLFLNIYLGSLGEEIGRHLFESFGIELQPLEKGEYELFDFKLSNRLYVDFKFWGAGTAIDNESQKEKILEKMRRTKATSAMIVNIVTPDPKLQPVVGMDGIIEIPGLIDLDSGKVLSEVFLFIHQMLERHA